MGWKQSGIPQYHICIVSQCRPKGTLYFFSFVLLQLRKADGKVEGIIWNICVNNGSLLFRHKCDLSLPCTLPPISIPFRCFMSKTANLHWRPDWWLKSCEGKPCVWDQLLLFLNLLSMALMQLNIWAIAFSIVPAGTVCAVLDSSRLFSQQLTTSYPSKEEISPTLFACVLTFWFPYSLFFEFT